ncbi:hypothetical protein GUJ93_ZPchr0010g9144 [Zizania palustris]|uniref:Uncharacterized protein n=1 Tax=Zizania palustris TaxID=103762 RepID=A0A8J5T9M3_ZIZPA|nr:hypothetical protein GUJ93_ZPchr0010g9144 [Zizania palustris]
MVFQLPASLPRARLPSAASPRFLPFTASPPLCLCRLPFAASPPPPPLRFLPFAASPPLCLRRLPFAASPLPPPLHRLPFAASPPLTPLHRLSFTASPSLMMFTRLELLGSTTPKGVLAPSAASSDPMAPTSKLSQGIKKVSRSHTYHCRGLWAIKAKHGGAFPKAMKTVAVAAAAAAAAAAAPKFYPADDGKPRQFHCLSRIHVSWELLPYQDRSDDEGDAFFDRWRKIRTCIASNKYSGCNTQEQTDSSLLSEARSFSSTD